MRTLRTLLRHAAFILMPVVVLFGIYGISLLVCAWCEPSEGLRNLNAENFSEASEENSEADVFAQTGVFSDADLCRNISDYEGTLPGVSARVGLSVLLNSDTKNGGTVLSKDSPAEETGALAVKTPDTEKDAPKTALAPLPEIARPGEADIWRIETSYASHLSPTAEQVRKLVFYRWRENRWEKSSDEAFFENPDAAQPVIFYVHGNRTELNTAAMQGLSVLKSYPGEETPRLVIWTWDSERVSCRPKIEYYTKARYSDFQGFYLAEILEELGAKRHVILVGHSFGGRTILSAMHLLAGGTFNRKSMTAMLTKEELTDAAKRGENQVKNGPKPAKNSKSENEQTLTQNTEMNAEENAAQNSAAWEIPVIDALLVAPALECSALNPNAMYSHALESAAHLNVTRNGSDPALKFYPLMNGARTRLPEAMGFVGPSLSQDISESLRVKVQVIPLDYNTHQFLEYMALRSVQNGLRFYQ